MNLSPLPAPLTMRDPAVLLATGFGSGRLKPAPGTWGSLAAWVIGLALLMTPFGKAALILAFLIALVAGWLAVERIETLSGEHDQGMIVIDEWAGLWLGMLLCPINAATLGLVFVLFRVFDIWKPGPIGWLDKNLSGASGVMADDLAAGLVAGLLIYGMWAWI